MPGITSAIIGISAIAGTAASLYGTAEQTRAASRQSEEQQRIIEAQQRQEELRRKAMELDARRKQLEVLRNTQRARATALATTTAQGVGQGGSALGGAYGQIAGYANTNALGIDQQLSFGRENFSINSDISSARIGIAQAQGQAALGAGISSFGGNLLNMSSTLGRIGQGFGGTSSTYKGAYGGAPNSYMYGGSQVPYFQ